MIIERIKFYADTPIEKNKLFCWKINSILDFEETLIGFMMKDGWSIRAAWYEKFDNETGELKNNVKIKDLQPFINKAIERARKTKKTP